MGYDISFSEIEYAVLITNLKHDISDTSKDKEAIYSLQNLYNVLTTDSQYNFLTKEYYIDVNEHEKNYLINYLIKKMIIN